MCRRPAPVRWTPPRSPRRTLPQLALLSLLSLALSAGACSHVVAHDADYYNDGPYQKEGPQGVLKAGTSVLVIGREGSYAHVLAPGVNAYVWEQALLGWWEYQQLQQRQRAAEKEEKQAQTLVTTPEAPAPAPAKE